MWGRAGYSNPRLDDDVVDRDFTMVCVLEQFHRALRVRDVFAVLSYRWGDSRAQLLTGFAWNAVRQKVIHGLSLSDTTEPHFAGLGGALAPSWCQLARIVSAAVLACAALVSCSQRHRSRTT
jgi:hypothetical protein